MPANSANFIVIGAPKAGTTALYWYLAEHPQIFMSPVKETNYFAYGRDETGGLLYGDPEIHHFPVRTDAEYDALFANTGNALAIGEASPIYLECPMSAARIRARIPNARIICGLRNPVDRAWSDYLMYLRHLDQPFDAVRDFSTTARWTQPGSHWMRVSRYHETLQRYFDIFPREQIHVFLFDELTRNPRGGVQDIYRFLEVDPDFSPNFSIPYNTGGLPTNRLLERVFNRTSLKNAVEPWIPKRTMQRLRQLRAANLQKAPPLPAELRAQLADHFHDDIVRTSKLIGRNLDNWLQSTARPTAESPSDARSVFRT